MTLFSTPHPFNGEGQVGDRDKHNYYIITRENSGPIILLMISNGRRTEWSAIRSLIIQVTTKSDDREVEVRFVDHEYDFKQNWMTRSSVAN